MKRSPRIFDICLFLIVLDCVSLQSIEEYNDLKGRVSILEHLVDNQQMIIERQQQHFEDKMIEMELKFQDPSQQPFHSTGEVVKPKENKIETGKIIGKESSTVLYVSSSFACMGNMTYMSCPDGKKIFTSHAHYGEYKQGCGASQCCLPNPRDCTEVVSENDEAEWVALKYACDNRTECDYLFRGAVFINNECGVGENVHYLNVYYTCMPSESDAGPIAFSAHANQDRDYDDDDLVIFEEIQTNIHGAYQANSSVFLCPVDGVYAFSTTILTTDGGRMGGGIYIEKASKGGFKAEAVEGIKQHGSHFVIVECNAWQRVWVMATSDGCRMYGTYNDSTFSGFLIYRY